MKAAYKVKEFAQMFGLSERGVYAAVEAGQIPKVPLPSTAVRIPSWYVDEILQKPTPAGEKVYVIERADVI